MKLQNRTAIALLFLIGVVLIGMTFFLLNFQEDKPRPQAVDIMKIRVDPFQWNKESNSCDPSLINQDKITLARKECLSSNPGGLVVKYHGPACLNGNWSYDGEGFDVPTTKNPVCSRGVTLRKENTNINPY